MTRVIPQHEQQWSFTPHRSGDIRPGFGNFTKMRWYETAFLSCAIPAAPGILHSAFSTSWPAFLHGRNGSGRPALYHRRVLSFSMGRLPAFPVPRHSHRSQYTFPSPSKRICPQPGGSLRVDHGLFFPAGFQGILDRLRPGMVEGGYLHT